MKKILCLIFLFAGCSQKQPPAIVISNSDSEILFNGVPVADIEYALQQKGYTIRALTDTLEFEYDKLTSLEDSLSHQAPRDTIIRLPRTLTIALDGHLPHKLFLQIVVTCGRSRFNKLLIHGTPLGEIAQREIPLYLPLIDYGRKGSPKLVSISSLQLQYKIVIDQTGFYLLANDVSYKNKRVDYQRPSGILRISKINGQYDFARLQKEVRWLCDTLGKIGFNGHKNFIIAATSDSTDFQTIFTVMDAVLPDNQLRKTPLNASMLDVANERPRRQPKVLIYRETSAERDSQDILISIGRLVDWESGIPSSESEEQTRHALLCLEDLLCFGVETDNRSLIKNTINRGASVNNYLNEALAIRLTGLGAVRYDIYIDSLIGLTPLMLAIQYNRTEMVQTLVELGADVNKPSLEHTEREVPPYLRSQGNFRSQGYSPEKFLSKSPLALAREKGNQTIIDILKKAGAR